MPTILRTKEARAAPVQRDREHNIEKVEAQTEARPLRELAKQHRLNGMQHGVALERLAAEDEMLKDLALKRLVVEMVALVLTEAGYVPGAHGGWRGDVVASRRRGAGALTSGLAVRCIPGRRPITESMHFF
jgi:hypothetical protein